MSDSSQTAVPGGLPTSRIETLADGVFAIVMTLLILEIKVPTLDGATSHELWERLLLLWPKLMSYVLSFMILGIYWIGHHNQFFYIRRTDRTLLWINILFMMCVAFIPFSTALMGEYPDLQLTVVIYGLNLIASGLSLFLHWKYATSRDRLVDRPVPPEVVRIVDRRILTPPAAYALAIALSFVSTRLSILLFVLTQLLYILPGRIDLHFGRKGE